ncbi:MAG: MerR family DNA-binding transcriptional regulator, partial [Peptococcaceae bacterium]|nr:MerR family DNA-binding transcriptional regulator [Peptococcaceae bacterium]
MTDGLELEYMTIGELTDKVGVTVRTIQYYDQENLLKPSAKGS